jgi:hypothetical protein
MKGRRHVLGDAQSRDEIGHERETNPCGHHVRHGASSQFRDPCLDTKFEKSQQLKQNNNKQQQQQL